MDTQHTDSLVCRAAGRALAVAHYAHYWARTGNGATLAEREAHDVRAARIVERHARSLFDHVLSVTVDPILGQAVAVVRDFDRYRSSGDTVAVFLGRFIDGHDYNDRMEWRRMVVNDSYTCRPITDRA